MFSLQTRNNLKMVAIISRDIEIMTTILLLFRLKDSSLIHDYDVNDYILPHRGAFP